MFTGNSFTCFSFPAGVGPGKVLTKGLWLFAGLLCQGFCSAVLDWAASLTVLWFFFLGFYSTVLYENKSSYPNLLIGIAFPFPPLCQNLRRVLQNLRKEAFDEHFAKSQI